MFPGLSLTRTAIKLLVTCILCGAFLTFALRSAQTAQQNAGAPSREGLEFFEKKIRPVLADNCYRCHSAQAKKPQGGLMLDSIEGMQRGGASGQPAVVPGDPEKSLLIKAIRYTDPKLQMPVGGKLPDQTIEDFQQWVKMGAPAPRDSSPAASASKWQPYNWEEAKKFWSFRPIKDYQAPSVKNRLWIKNPIDRFILAKLEEKGLTPIGDIGKRALIRRATFDLTGLPPTPDEVEGFLKDRSPNAFEKVVDRLLASSAYGEKWGRHWLDLVRYADTAGDNSDYPVPAAFRYRNYVIESFNQDKPYDRFIREQIAGDRHGNAIATGYLAISRRFGSRNKEMNLTIDDTIDNLGKTFLGLSTSCARCHDHKFDPIPQRDYYALYGIFNSIRYSFPGAEIYPHPAEMIALVSGKDAEMFYRQQKELSDLDDRKEFLTAEKGTALRNKKMKEEQTKVTSPKATTENNNKSSAQPDAETWFQSKKEERKPADYDRDIVNWGRAGESKRMPEEVEAEMERVKARIAELHTQYANVPKAYAVAEGLPTNARIHRKGDPKNLGDEVPRGFLTILGGQQVPKDDKSSGRELLAGWIADANNPLTARVMINRIWQYHFGKGLVQTPNDFGTRGRAPTHPELLDWLATRFIEGGWSIKRMHKLIMLSHAYQLASAPASAGSLMKVNHKIDVNNDYLWRFNRRRLEAEEIRDAILFTSGMLDRTVGGEHPFPAETSWHFTQHAQFFAVYDSNQRSVYLMQQRLKKHPFFEVFDGADQNATTGNRTESVTPLQALFLMNNPLVHEQADNLAARVGRMYNTMPGQIDYAFRLAYGRPAKPSEIKEALTYIEQTKQKLQALNFSPQKLAQAALASYLHVLLSSNEFLYVD